MKHPVRFRWNRRHTRLFLLALCLMWLCPHSSEVPAMMGAEPGLGISLPIDVDEPRDQESEGDSSSPEESPSDIEELSETGEEPSQESEESGEEASEEEQLPQEDAESSVIVYTTQQMRTAITSPSVTDIYMGADIYLELTGMEINAAKPYLNIDGINPEAPEEGRHTLYQHNSTNEWSNLYLNNNSGPKDIRIQNMIIQGANYYGVVHIGSEVRSVTLIFENIEYYGPQMVFNRRGTAHFIDCDIKLGHYNGNASEGELGELTHVIFEGGVTVEQTRAQGNEIIYMELEQNGTVTVMPYANVEISTYSTSGFLYATALAAPKMTVGEGAVFRFTSPQRFWRNSPLRRLTIERNAEVYLTVTNSLQNTLLRVEGDVIVNPGGILHLFDYSGSTAFPAMLITRFDVETPGSSSFDDPRSVVLYSPGMRTVQYETAGAMKIDAEQIRYWTAKGESSFDNPPLYDWRQENGSSLELTASFQAGSGIVTALQSDYDNSGPELSASTFTMTQNRILAFGYLPLSAQYQFLSDTLHAVSGTTAPGALVRLLYQNSEGDTVILGDVATADEEGSFVIPFAAGGITELTVITVQSNHWYLQSEDTVVVPGSELHFSVLPKDLTFPTLPLSSREQIIYRSNADWAVEVVDYRAAGAEWQLSVQVLRHMTPIDHSLLPPLRNALVFRNQLGNITVIPDDTPLPLYRHVNAGPGETTQVQWPQDQGIALRVTPGTAVADEQYRAVLQWTLANAPQ